MKTKRLAEPLQRNNLLMSFRWKTFIVLLMASVTLSGCAYMASLIPREMFYEVSLTPVLSEGRGEYQIDPDDSKIVMFSHEGMVVKVRPYTDDELNRLYPPLYDGRHTNPYTTDALDVDLGYVPPIFMVFDVTVVNKTYSKIEFDPAKTRITTDTGRTLRYYDPGRAGEGVDPLGGNRFSTYYQTERGRSGIDKDINLERMGLIYKTAFHRFRPVFRGDERSGTLTFDKLPQDAKEIVLTVSDFVLSFDASGNPERTIDFECRFAVNQGVIESEVDPILE